MPDIERANHLRALADALVARKDAIGTALARESGKRLPDATQRTMGETALRDKLAAQAMFADLHIGPAALDFLKAERAKWKPIVDALPNLRTG